VYVGKGDDLAAKKKELEQALNILTDETDKLLESS